MQASEIRRFAPGANAELVNAIADHWDKAEGAGINSPRRIQHFMARVAVETGGLRSVSEGLNYSPEGLTGTFGKKRISAADAQRLGRTRAHRANQEGIANVVYGGAWGKTNLGNTQPGDGWRYRGGGMLQTTGRANYKKMGFEDHPESLRDPVTAFATACREWERRGCNAAADKDDAARVCKLINGGTNGLTEQRAYLAKAKKVWPGGSTPVSRAVSFASVPANSKIEGIEVKNPVGHGIGIEPDAPVVDAAIVQRRLQELGYTFAGRIDGDPGPATEAAVMSFKRVNELEPITPDPDDAFIRTLMSMDAKPFPLSEERQNTTEADLRAEGSKTIERADKVENASNVGLIGGGAGAVITALSSAFSTVREYIYPVQEFFLNVPGWAWFLLIAGGAGYITWKARHIRQGRVQAAREGRTFGTAGS